jgi:WhiB family redox-sensing transcriptional regulator
MSTATLLAALSIDVDDWYDQGACVQDGADLFFARPGELDTAKRAVDAKNRCASCPVLTNCREWVLAAGDPAGIWAGGTTTAERAALELEFGLAS